MIRRALLVGLSAAFCACAAPDDVTYRPAAQILPANIRKIAIRPMLNKTQQFGLEDKLTLRVRDEFLRDGRYSIVPESDSDGVVVGTLTRYILQPVQYDAVLTPTVYKLRILLTLQFIDRTANTILWEEPNLEGSLIYPASTLQGGLTEEQARESIWDQLSRTVVRRVLEGFGSVTGTSQRAISDQAPPHEPPAPPPKPINPNPY
ncbi:MAG: hypothetical protein HY551_08340 [Elusimicrobia bacterium]|nr:hypothetical protein [Elusimicrobiota bacterium]